MEEIRCLACLTPITDAVHDRVRREDVDRPWHCHRCDALLFLTRDVDGADRAARMVMGLEEAEVAVQMDVAPGVHLVCAWDPNHPLNATRVADIVGVNLARVLRLIREKAFPNARREGRAWRIPMRDVRAYLMRRAVRR